MMVDLAISAKGFLDLLRCPPMSCLFQRDHNAARVGRVGRLLMCVEVVPASGRVGGATCFLLDGCPIQDNAFALSVAL